VFATTAISGALRSGAMDDWDWATGRLGVRLGGCNGRLPSSSHFLYRSTAAEKHFQYMRLNAAKAKFTDVKKWKKQRNQVRFFRQAQSQSLQDYTK